MASISIRPAADTDTDCIVDFNQRLARETEGVALDRTVLEKGVRALLSDPTKGRYFLAVADGDAVAGQLMFTWEWSDWRNGHFWWLQSVYVVPEFRKQGVFSALFDHVSDLARADPEVCGIRLYVDKDNAPAQSTYGARGFERAHYEVMELLFSSPAQP